MPSRCPAPLPLASFPGLRAGAPVSWPLGWLFGPALQLSRIWLHSPSRQVGRATVHVGLRAVSCPDRATIRCCAKRLGPQPVPPWGEKQGRRENRREHTWAPPCPSLPWLKHRGHDYLSPMPWSGEEGQDELPRSHPPASEQRTTPHTRLIKPPTRPYPHG